MLLQTHPDLQIILYISGSGGLLERMAACAPDIMSIDQHVDMRDAIQRIGPKFAVQVFLFLWQCTTGMQTALVSCSGGGHASVTLARYSCRRGQADRLVMIRARAARLTDGE